VSALPHAAVRARRAFTLVEVLIVVAISAVLFMSLATFATRSIQTTEVLQEQNLASHTGRMALLRITREAALAKVITAAEEYTLSFTCTDVTGDGADDALIYAWDPGTRTLTRVLNGVTETFAENVDLFLLEYEYETENQVTIASAGDVLPFTVGKFDGTEYAIDGNFYLDIWNNWAAHYFVSEAGLPSVDSVTVRAARKVEGVPTADMIIALHDDATGQALALGRLHPSQLTTSFTDITVPMTWMGGEGVEIQPDTIYRLYTIPDGWSGEYAGSILVARLEEPELPEGCGWWFANVGSPITPKRDWTMYFNLSGNLPVATPRRSTVPVSILKKIKLTITTTEGDQQTTVVRSCKVVNQ